MGKPTKTELISAFEQADSLQEHGIDRGYLAKALYALSTQANEMEKVLNACESYFRSGQSVTDHRKIISGIKSYHNLSSTTSITESEMECALSVAAQMREQDDDPDFIAKAILSFNYLHKHLYKVFRSAERYFHSGMQSSTLTELENNMRSYRTLESRAAGHDARSASIY